MIMALAVRLERANVMKGFMVTAAQVNFLSFLHKLYQKLWQQSKAMKSCPLLGLFCGSEFWGFSLMNI